MRLHLFPDGVHVWMGDHGYDGDSIYEVEDSPGSRVAIPCPGSSDGYQTHNAEDTEASCVSPAWGVSQRCLPISSQSVLY